jgi:hypothetical protein
VRILGLTIIRNKAVPDASPVGPGSGGWWSLIQESFSGAWQRNISIKVENVLTYTAVFSCISLIANDLAKLRLRLVRQDDDGIWVETESSAFSPVLRRPNRYQNRIQFISQWVTSKLVHGNTYVLKQRDQRGIVTALHILHPRLVTVLVTDDGSVYYELFGIICPASRVSVWLCRQERLFTTSILRRIIRYVECRRYRHAAWPRRKAWQSSTSLLAFLSVVPSQQAFLARQAISMRIRQDASKNTGRVIIPGTMPVVRPCLAMG